MRKHSVLAGLAAAGVLALAAGSYVVAHDEEDRDRRFSARLSGYQEVPANSTTGHGRFSAKLDEEAGVIVIRYKLSYADLEGTTTLAAHIHLGQRTANGGISAFLCGGGDKPACPATATDDEIEGVIDPADVIGPAGQGIAAGELEELVRAMRAGVTYANVHTNKHPGGEIRGQIGRNNHRGSDDH